MQPVSPIPGTCEMRWPFRRPAVPTHEGERVGARVVLARLDAAIDRLDGVWEHYYAPVEQRRNQSPPPPEQGRD